MQGKPAILCNKRFKARFVRMGEFHSLFCIRRALFYRSGNFLHRNFRWRILSVLCGKKNKKALPVQNL
ncbi:MAG: hypothetical protein B6245_08705 [Desulfobacteraceae bacterium 4572_88]|nr:MAG: hypothetical protein B6245_08705 [Desulfobacteraceae bacterium 4572_88]